MNPQKKELLRCLWVVFLFGLGAASEGLRLKLLWGEIGFGFGACCRV